MKENIVNMILERASHYNSTEVFRHTERNADKYPQGTQEHID